MTAHIILIAVSKTTRELLLKWGNEPVRLSSEVKMPQFLVENVIAESCDESSVMGESSSYISHSYLLHVILQYL